MTKQQRLVKELERNMELNEWQIGKVTFHTGLATFHRTLRLIIEILKLGATKR